MPTLIYPSYQGPPIDTAPPTPQPPLAYYKPFNEPVRIPLRLHAALQPSAAFLNFSALQIIYSQWYQWFSDPVRIKPGTGVINYYPSFFSLGHPLFNIGNTRLPLNIQNNGGISENQDWGGRIDV